MTRPSIDWGRAFEIFEVAADLPTAEREVYVASACEGDEPLRKKVEALLSADQGRGSLDEPLERMARGLLEGGGWHPEDRPAESDGDPLIGRTLGAYRVLRLLGRGGMGAVYLAERADGTFQREVALKVVRGGLGSAALQQRFLREREILGRLEHPNIARLLDGGLTEEGTPYLVMERVEGLPITAYAERAGLELEPRIDLFLQVLSAVRHAHRNLVIHRDLKPSNILVNDEGEVRLLDFGIARLVEDNSEAQEALTRTGMLVLTPEYAAPEQIRGEVPTTATDVHALGAVLYELLSGSKPRDLEGRSWTEIERALTLEPLVPPSTRATTPVLRRRLRGDMDTIVLQALHPEPDARYATVDALAEDLLRYRRKLPVAALPRTVGYRVRRFLARHAAGVTAAALVLASLVVGLVGTLWQAREASLEARRADAVASFLFDLFGGADPERNLGAVPDARDLLARGVARLDSLGPGAGAELRLDLLLTMAQLHGRLGLHDQQRELYARAVAESRQTFGSDDVRTAGALDGLGVALMELGDLDEAGPALEEARRIRASRGAPDTVLAETVSNLATLAGRRGETDRSLALHRDALELDRRGAGPETARVASDLNDIGSILVEQEEYAEAETLLEEALAIRRRALGERHPAVAITLGILGELHAALGERAEAERYHRQALEIQRLVYPDGHPDIARSLDQLAIQVGARGRTDEADSLYAEALDLRRTMLGANHPDVATTLNNLAVLRYRTGAYAEAADAMRDALDVWQVVHGERHPLVATGLNNLGAMLRELGDLESAESALSEALELRRELRGEGHTDVGMTLNNLGGVRLMQGRLADARTFFQEALTIFEANLPPEHPRIADAAWGLGAGLVEAGRAEEALPHLERALAIREAVIAEGDPRVSEARLWRAIAWARLGRTDEARAALEAAYRSLVARVGPNTRAARRAAEELERLGH